MSTAKDLLAKAWTAPVEGAFLSENAFSRIPVITAVYWIFRSLIPKRSLIKEHSKSNRRDINSCHSCGGVSIEVDLVDAYVKDQFQKYPAVSKAIE